MNYIVYPRLSTISKKAIKKRTTRYGRPFQYIPRTNLVDRLARELGMTEQQVLDQIRIERKELLLSLRDV